MTTDEVKLLIGGEKVSNIYDDNILIIPPEPKVYMYNDREMIYCIKECDNGNVLWRAYYPEEIDLVETAKICTCDIIRLMSRGCTCGGN